MKKSFWYVIGRSLGVIRAKRTTVRRNPDQNNQKMRTSQAWALEVPCPIGYDWWEWNPCLPFEVPSGGVLLPLSYSSRCPGGTLRDMDQSNHY